MADDQKRPEDRVFTCPIPSRRPTAREVPPPRTSTNRRNDRTVAPPRPQREEPRYEPPPQLSPMSNLGDVTRSQLEAALVSADARAIKKALEAAFKLGLDHPAVHEERSRRDRERRKTFKGAMAAAKAALKTARALRGEHEVVQAISDLRTQVAVAQQNDVSGRAEARLFKQLGTSKDELDLLPLLTLTAVPDAQKTTGVFERRRSRPRRVMPDIASPPTPDPIRRIAPSERIEPEPPGKIAQNGDGSYRLILPDGTVYRMERDDELGWVYWQGEKSHLRLFSDTPEGRRPIGFTSDLPVSHIVPERDVSEPLLAFVHEQGDTRACYLAVQMQDDRVIVYEVPWSDELLKGELVEIVPRGFAHPPQSPLKEGGGTLDVTA